MHLVWAACGGYVLGHLVGYAVGLRRGRILSAAQAGAMGAMGAAAYTLARKKLAEREGSDKLDE